MAKLKRADKKAINAVHYKLTNLWASIKDYPFTSVEWIDAAKRAELGVQAAEVTEFLSRFKYVLAESDAIAKRLEAEVRAEVAPPAGLHIGGRGSSPDDEGFVPAAQRPGQSAEVIALA